MSNVIVKLHGCEILCYKDTVTLYRQGKVSKHNTLMSDTIYKDAQKGNAASNELIQSAFGHTDIPSAIEQILTEGEFSMSTAELRSLKSVAVRAVIGYIKKNYLNPTGDREYTESTIESALNNCKCIAQIDHRKSAEQNFNAIKSRLLGKFMLKPKPGSIPWSVSLSWKQHAKLYAQYKPYVQTMTNNPDGQGCTLELLIPPKDIDKMKTILTSIYE